MSGLVLLVGTGSQAYREYLLRSLAREYAVWLFAESDQGWESPYLAGRSVVDTSDADAMIEPARRVAPDAVLTWDDTRVVPTARVACALGLPSASPEAALRCRDKHATRTALAAAGVPQASSTLVPTLAQARVAAARIGYPVVLKARALAASVGVVLVETPDQLAARFRVARGATAPGATEIAPGDVLVEEFLDGPEISVDAAWHGGVMAMAFVARKQIGFPPYFEETGHLVDGADSLLDDATLREVVTAAHAAIGFETGWTHTEVRLTPSGPKIVEINARIGGDRIPYVAELALGVEAAPIAASVACGRPPAIRHIRRRVAAVSFLYPRHDTIAKAVHVDHSRLPSTVDSVEPLALPGQELRLPPAGHVTSRYALVTVVADTIEQCRTGLVTAACAVHLESL